MGSDPRLLVDLSSTLSSSYFRIPMDINQQDDASLALTLGQAKPELNLELSLSTSYAEVSQELSSFQNSICSSLVVEKKQLIDEGSTSSKWKLGPIHSGHAYMHMDKGPVNEELSISSLLDSGVTHENPRKKAAAKTCLFKGCKTGARGVTGLCIHHGGGKRCKKEGCKRSAECKTVLCIAHGGGRRCQHPGCDKGAQGRTMLCKAHGGGIRCTFSGCERSAADGSTQLCKGHGGGKRCTHEEGCNKSAHGGTLFCVRHGGGKRCAALNCKTNARDGKTGLCALHGGGKRCKHEGCGISAQGGTDFCKTHGGGKRCSWGQMGLKFGDHSSAPCDKFARGKSGLCSAHNAQVGSAVQYLQTPQSQETELKQSESISVVENSNSVQFSLPEGRVHGGNLMAMLHGNAIFGNNV